MFEQLFNKKPEMDYEMYSQIMDMKFRHDIEENEKAINPYYPYIIDDFIEDLSDRENYSHIIRFGKYQSDKSKPANFDLCFWVTINNKERKHVWSDINLLETDLITIFKTVENNCREQEGSDDLLKIDKKLRFMKDREILEYILKMQMITFHAATGEYLKRLCEVWDVKYSDTETDEVIRERLLQQMPK